MHVAATASDVPREQEERIEGRRLQIAGATTGLVLPVSPLIFLRAWDADRRVPERNPQVGRAIAQRESASVAPENPAMQAALAVEVHETTEPAVERWPQRRCSACARGRGWSAGFTTGRRAAERHDGEVRDVAFSQRRDVAGERRPRRLSVRGRLHRRPEGACRFRERRGGGVHPSPHSSPRWRRRPGKPGGTEDRRAQTTSYPRDTWDKVSSFTGGAGHLRRRMFRPSGPTGESILPPAIERERGLLCPIAQTNSPRQLSPTRYDSALDPDRRVAPASYPVTRAPYGVRQFSPWTGRCWQALPNTRAVGTATTTR